MAMATRRAMPRTGQSVSLIGEYHAQPERVPFLPQ